VLETALRAAVGDAHVLTDDDARAGYETDWTGRFSSRARAVVRPADTAEVVAVVRACAEHGAAIVPQGGNTGMVGAGVPRGGEVLVPLLTARVAAIVPLGSLGEAAGLLAEVRPRLPSLEAADFFLDDGLQLVLEHLGIEAPVPRAPAKASRTPCRSSSPARSPRACCRTASRD